MSEQKILPVASLEAFFARLRAAGRRIVAPRRSAERVSFAEVESAKDVVLDALISDVSPKQVVFPRFEPLVFYRLDGAQPTAVDPPTDFPPTVLFGVRPCDAASLASLEAIFTWGSPDLFFEKRRAATTVVTIACTEADEDCFCTSVGGSPGNTSGSDVRLRVLQGGDFLADALTDKGREILQLAQDALQPAPASPVCKPLADVPVRFDAAQLTGRLPGLFEAEGTWTEQSLACLGCGTCAFVCPACACFDIQDEPDRAGGSRLRCWDSCGFGLFTLHTSGHNPRATQSQRWRQRVMHKFSYMPQRVGQLGCVGCGRCIRACPADMNLAEHLQALAEA